MMCCVEGEAVYARCLSSLKDERVAASKVLKGPASKFQGDKKLFTSHIQKVFVMVKTICRNLGSCPFHQTSNLGGHEENCFINLRWYKNNVILDHHNFMLNTVCYNISWHCTDYSAESRLIFNNNR